MQLQGYNRYMKDILFRYSFMYVFQFFSIFITIIYILTITYTSSMNKEAKFSMRKLAKKGVLISSSLTEEQYILFLIFDFY